MCGISNLKVGKTEFELFLGWYGGYFSVKNKDKLITRIGNTDEYCNTLPSKPTAKILKSFKDCMEQYSKDEILNILARLVFNAEEA